jgi:hypothetical protein
LEKDITTVMGWRGNVARMGEMRKMRRGFLEDRDVNGRKILKWMLSNGAK